VADRSLNHHALCKNAKEDSTTCVPSGRVLSRAAAPAPWSKGQRLCSHLRAFYSGSGERGGAQLSPGREVAHTGTHSSPACWSMESPEREEPSGALLAFDWQAHLDPLQEVSDASAPP
jgi:hypothetical protein